MVGRTATLPMQLDKERLEVITKGVPITGLVTGWKGQGISTKQKRNHPDLQNSTPTKE